MDAIVSALALVRSMVPRATALPADIDLVAEEEPQGTEIVATIRALVEVLLDDMVVGNVQQSLFDGSSMSR